MAKKIGIGLAAVVVVLFGYIMMQPSTSHIERSAVIHAPRAVVWDFINTMEKRAAWYPWDRLDPNMKRTYGDVKAGVGATYAWEGNDDVGSGNQKIIESVPMDKVVDELNFTTPMEAKNIATFVLADDPAGTKVTWMMDGGMGFMTKVGNAFMDMDALVGADFEKGLGFLDEQAKAVVVKEAEAKAAADAAAAAAAAAPPADGAAPPEGEAKGTN